MSETETKIVLAFLKDRIRKHKMADQVLAQAMANCHQQGTHETVQYTDLVANRNFTIKTINEYYAVIKDIESIVV